MMLTSDIGRIFLSIGVVLLCIALFVGTYVLNRRTEKPDGCETPDCEGCQLTECSRHPDKKQEQKKEREEKND